MPDRLSSSAVSGVTTKVLVSTAGAGSRACSPSSDSCSRSRPTVSSTSEVASPANSFRNSSIDATYSGAKLMSPDSKAGTSRSRNPPSSWYSTE